jgi:hypothetical protein
MGAPKIRSATGGEVIQQADETELSLTGCGFLAKQRFQILRQFAPKIGTLCFRIVVCVPDLLVGNGRISAPEGISARSVA